MKKRGTEDCVLFPQTDFKVTIEYDDGTIYTGRARDAYCECMTDYADISASKLELGSLNEHTKNFGPLELTDWEIVRYRGRKMFKVSWLRKLRRFLWR